MSQKFIYVDVVEAIPMTEKEAAAKGLTGRGTEQGVSALKESTAEGFEVDGFWIEKNDFLKNNSPVTDKEIKQLEKIKSIPQELSFALKVKDQVEQLEKKKYSFKQLGEAITKVYKVKLADINNDNNF